MSLTDNIIHNDDKVTITEDVRTTSTTASNKHRETDDVTSACNDGKGKNAHKNEVGLNDNIKK